MGIFKDDEQQEEEARDFELVERVRRAKPKPEDVKDGDCLNCGAPRSHERHHPFATFTRDCCVFNEKNPPPAEPMDLYGAPVACVDGRPHQLNGNSDIGRCLRCGFSWRRLHTMTGFATIGTGAVVLSVGKAKTELQTGMKIGTGV